MPPEVYASRYAQGVQFTDVGGERAVYVVDVVGSSHGILHWQHAGVSYGLGGSTGMTDLKRIAEGASTSDSTTRVSPRLLTSRPRREPQPQHKLSESQ